LCEALLRKHLSHSPNRLIATCFFNTGVIERWGGGTLRMVTDLEDQQQPRPEFDISTPNVFKVIMFASGHTDSKLEELGLNDRQVGAIHYLQLKDTMTVAEYQTLFEASKATATRDIGDLVRKRFFIREGIGKSVRYRIAEST
jgi:ATP-dependent DNA helicase RecG